MEHYGEVYFALHGKNFDPDEITRAVGIEPTATRRQGVPTPKISSWIVSAGQVGGEVIYIHECSARLVAALATRCDRIAQVRQQYDLSAVLQVVLYLSPNGRPQPVLNFPAEVVAFLGAVGGFIDVDWYIRGK